MLTHPVTPILLGFALDLLVGDPPNIPHLVRMLGALIALLERLLWSRRHPLLGGCLLVLIVLALSFWLPVGLLRLADGLSPLAGLLLRALFCWQLFAVKDLKTQSMRVYHALWQHDLTLARKQLSYIVGRDTEHLDEAGVVRAAVETVAENTADGVIAPLFYLALGGIPLGCAYKAINTMDSMVGYKNERYLCFGRCAARLDDLANFLPSRIAALLMMIGSALLRLDAKNAWRIFVRDRHNHTSPNSAQTEAVAAGALRVQLAGNAYYFGLRVVKPTIGDSLRPIHPDDIVTINRLLYVTAGLGLLTAATGRIAVGLF